jgi:creatinine deaminase
MERGAVLDERIGAPDRRQFTAVRDPREWKNPFVLINHDGSVTVITDGSVEQTLQPEELKQFLLNISPAGWPFGRVISLRPCAARSDSKEQFELEDQLIKRSWGIMRETLRSLHVEINVWPSGETTHATVSRDTTTPLNDPSLPSREEMLKFMRAAIDEAKQGVSEGGIPVGAVLVKDGEIVARGHNRRMQSHDPTGHAEIDCLRNAGRLKNYRGTILYTTLMPCAMCGGASIQLKVPLVVAGEDRTFPSSRRWMEASGVKVVDLDLDECYQMLQEFAKAYPDAWKEDIGEL